jgi:hypothetical protein
MVRIGVGLPLYLRNNKWGKFAAVGKKRLEVGLAGWRKTGRDAVVARYER